MNRMLRGFALTFFCGLLALPLTNALAAKGGKNGGGGGGGGGGEASQTIFYTENDWTYAIDENGENKSLVGDARLNNAAPSSLVYGSDPMLDRWWVTIDGVEVPDANGTTLLYEVYAVHPGREVNVQLTDVLSDGRVVLPLTQRNHVRLSNDGQDSFLSFISFDAATGNDRRLHRINVPLTVMEAMVADGSWVPLRLASPWIETVWVDGPGTDAGDPGFIQVLDDYDWSPDGQHLALKTKTYEANASVFLFQRYSLDTLQLSIITTDVYSSFGTMRWAPANSPRANSIVYRGSGLQLTETDGTSDPEVILETSSKLQYYAPHWSPAGDRFVVASATRGKGAFSNEWRDAIVISTLSGNRTTIVSSSESAKTPLGWVANEPAPGY